MEATNAPPERLVLARIVLNRSHHSTSPLGPVNGSVGSDLSHPPCPSRRTSNSDDTSSFLNVRAAPDYLAAIPGQMAATGICNEEKDGVMSAYSGHRSTGSGMIDVANVSSRSKVPPESHTVTDTTDTARSSNGFCSSVSGNVLWKSTMESTLNLLAQVTARTEKTHTHNLSVHFIVRHCVAILLNILVPSGGGECASVTHDWEDRTTSTATVPTVPQLYDRYDFLSILLCAMQRHVRSSILNAVALYMLYYDLSHRRTGASRRWRAVDTSRSTPHTQSHRRQLKRLLIELGNQVVTILERFPGTCWIQELGLAVLLTFTISRPLPSPRVHDATLRSPKANQDVNEAAGAVGAAPIANGSSARHEPTDFVGVPPLHQMLFPQSMTTTMFFDADFWFTATYRICDALSTHFTSTPAICQSALSLLAWLCQDDVFASIVWTYKPTRGIALKEPSLPVVVTQATSTCMADTVVAVMRFHPFHASIQSLAVSLLTCSLNSSYFSETRAPPFASNDKRKLLTDAVYESLQNHRENPLVFSHCVCLLIAMSPPLGAYIEENVEDGRLPRGPRVLAAVVDGMTRFSHIVNVQTCCLWWMFKWFNGLATASAPPGSVTLVLPHVLRSMNQHPNEAPLQEEACRVLTAMTNVSANDVWGYSTDGNTSTAVSAVLRAWRLHANYPALVDEAALFLHAVLRVAAPSASTTANTAFQGGFHVVDAIWSGFEVNQELGQGYLSDQDTSSDFGLSE